MKKILLIIILFLLNPNIVKAENNCSVTQLTNLRKLANTVTVNFAYDKTITTDGFFEDIKIGVFKITVNNLGSQLYAEEKSTEKKAYQDTNIIYELPSNNLYTINIYAIDGCTDEPLLTRYVNIPKYNPFSEKEECKTYKDFYMCNKWYGINITESEFNKALQTYIDTLNNKEDPTIEEQEDIWYQEIFNFLKTNYIYIGVGIIVIVGIIIIISKRNKKDEIV